MRYCQFEGCSNTTEKELIVQNMLGSQEKRKSQSMFIIMTTNHFIEQKHGRMSLTLSMKEKTAVVKDVAVLYLEGKHIGIM